MEATVKYFMHCLMKLDRMPDISQNKNLFKGAKFMLQGWCSLMKERISRNTVAERLEWPHLTFSKEFHA
jgi:hypothetical protein